MHGVKFEHSFKSLQIWLDVYNKTVQVHEVFPDRLSAQIKVRDGSGILIGPLVERLDNRPIILSNQFTNYSSNNDDYADMPPLMRVDHNNDNDSGSDSDSDSEDLPPLEDDTDDDMPPLISTIGHYTNAGAVQEYQSNVLLDLDGSILHSLTTEEYRRQMHMQPFQIFQTNFPQPTGNTPSMGDTYLFDNYDEYTTISDDDID